MSSSTTTVLQSNMSPRSKAHMPADLISIFNATTSLTSGPSTTPFMEYVGLTPTSTLYPWAKMVQNMFLKITLVFQHSKLALYQWILLWDLSRESEMRLLVLDQCFAQLRNAVKEVLMLPAERTFLDYFFPPIRNKICYVVSPERLSLVFTFTEWAVSKLHLKETDTVAPFNCLYCYYVRTDERNYDLFYRKVYLSGRHYVALNIF